MMLASIVMRGDWAVVRTLLKFLFTTNVWTIFIWIYGNTESQGI